MNSKSLLKTVVRRMKQSDPHAAPTLSFSEAANEIADALNIKHEAATMMLYGLCATGEVRWMNDQGEVIDEDECTIGDFNGKPKFVIASDVRSSLMQWSQGPLPSGREAVIAALIADGVNPPRNIKWKEFYKRVRDRCNAHLDAKGRAPFGFGDKQIQRIVNDLRAK
jgi:hypothetical protein